MDWMVKYKHVKKKHTKKTKSSPGILPNYNCIHVNRSLDGSDIAFNGDAIGLGIMVHGINSLRPSDAYMCQ